MARTSIVAAAKERGALVSDGAWGTFLFRRGLGKGQCPELWCSLRPSDVRDIASSYLASGADMIGTNSFGGTRIRLSAYGLSERAAELNEAAARLSREAVGSRAWVVGTMGPTGKIPALSDLTSEEIRDAFREQAIALARGGADALCIETMSEADEAAIAVRAAKEATGLEVICTFSFGRTPRGGYRTLSGLSPGAAAAAALDAGADIVGANCGDGFAGMIEVIKAMRPAARGAPIAAQANAGLPTSVDGIDTYPEGPEYAAALVPAMLGSGVDVVGGCCGTTPAHVAAIRRAVDEYLASLRIDRIPPLR